MSVSAAAYVEDHSASQLPWQQPSTWPDRVIVTMDADPATSISVSWRTNASVGVTKAEIAKALPDAKFDKAAISRTAETQLLHLAEVSMDGTMVPMGRNEGLPPTSHHSVRFDGLEPDTLYAYRVQGAKGQWSEWYQTRTAPQSGPLRFIYLGDGQSGLDSEWPRAIRAAYQAAPDARFIVHAGDLVNRGLRDLDWANWFRGGGTIHSMIPAIPVAGNHEYESVRLPSGQDQRILSPLWRSQFRLPEVSTLPSALHETVYDIRYGPDLHIFVLNSNMSDMGEQAAWLDKLLAQSDARWRIVTMHHPIYSSGRDRDNSEKREVILPVLLKHRVDLVLQGHDHTYARGSISAPGAAPKRKTSADARKITTMFVNSNAGAKQYPFSQNGWNDYQATGVTLDRKGENTQFYQIISIDDDKLHYASYTVDGALYDEVRMQKSKDGLKSIAASTTKLPAERSFENTLPNASVN